MTGQAEAEPDGDPSAQEHGPALYPPDDQSNSGGPREEGTRQWNDANQWSDSGWSQWDGRGDQSWGADW